MIYKIITNGLAVRKQKSFDRSGRPEFRRELSAYPHLSTIPDLSLPQVRIGNSLIFGSPRTPPITSCSWADNPCSYNPGTVQQTLNIYKGTSISPIAAQSQRNTCPAVEAQKNTNQITTVAVDSVPAPAIISAPARSHRWAPALVGFALIYFRNISVLVFQKVYRTISPAGLLQ